MRPRANHINDYHRDNCNEKNGQENETNTRRKIAVIHFCFAFFSVRSFHFFGSVAWCDFCWSSD